MNNSVSNRHPHSSAPHGGAPLGEKKTVCRGRLIVISGPSGVGKGTVIERYRAQRSDVRMSVSATTRVPRSGEVNGVHYYFLSKEEFLEQVQNDGMLEHATYSDNYYGTPRQFVEQVLKEGNDVILEIEVQGAMQVKKSMPDALLIFIMPPNFSALLERLCGRGTDNREVVQRRLEAAQDEIKEAKNYDFIVVNSTVERAVQELSTVISAAGCMTRCNKQFIKEVYNDVKTHVNTD